MMWAQLELRQYDRLPTFAVVVEDEMGHPVTLDYNTQTAVARFIGQRTGLVFNVHCQIAGNPVGTVTHDWEEGSVNATIDTYDVIVDIYNSDDTQALIAPTRRDAILVVRPHTPSSERPPLDNEPVYWDDITVPLWDDPSDTTRWS